jgi:NADH-quinone oxidoreductase subunit G
VPFYAGLTLDELGGRGVRWPEREQSSALPAGATISTLVAPPTPPSGPTESRAAAATGEDGAGRAANGALRLGTYRPIWADPEVEISPALQFTIARQQLELSPEDAQRLGIASGARVQVSQNGTRLEAHAAVRSDVPVGTVFLAVGIASESANELTDTTIEVSKR